MNFIMYQYASAIAFEHHAGQKYGEKSYYNSHLKVVKDKTEHLFFFLGISMREMDLLMSLSWLHDVIEDTDCTYEYIRERMIGDESILDDSVETCERSVENCERVDILIEAIDAITRRKGEDRKAYIYRCYMNPLAIKVKIADTLCNLEASVISGEGRRIMKYSEQLRTLTGIYNSLYLN